MESVAEDQRVENAKSNFGLSKRGATNFLFRDVWGPREKSMENPWSPTNPSGTVILRLAENSLLHDEIVEYFGTQVRSPKTYSNLICTGPRGSRRLRGTLAEFLTREFQFREELTTDNIFITSGVASALGALAWSICEDGEGVLIPQPYYNGFTFDLLNRSNTRIFGVTYQEIEGYSGLDDLFDPHFNAKALEVALRRAEKDGIVIRAVLISNPHNPLGRCYVRPTHIQETQIVGADFSQQPPETIKEFLSFCGRNQLHFISDEIYAKSIFPNPNLPNPTAFVSVLALDYRPLIKPELVHVLYGASKDFCANGLRLGLVCTKNEGIMGAMSSIGIFSWSPHVLQDVWATMLEDKDWLGGFMAKKTDLMAEHYRLTTSFLSEHGIGYYEMNGGLFLWVDLRHLFSVKSSCSPESDSSSLSVKPPNAPVYHQREQQIADICAKNGVLIAPGSVYVHEEFGWFRITSTLGKEALLEGLGRFWSSVQEAQSKS